MFRRLLASGSAGGHGMPYPCSCDRPKAAACFMLRALQVREIAWNEKRAADRGPFLQIRLVLRNLEHVLQSELNQPWVDGQGVDYPKA
jgi:hypothetical protein